MNDTTSGLTDNIDYEFSKTPVKWIAWRCYKSNYCSPDELIGYFQTKEKAEMAKASYIEAENKRCGRFLYSREHNGGGICCNQIKDIIIEQIEIE